MRLPSASFSARHSRWDRNEPRQFPEVLGGCGEKELVSRAGRTSQAQSAEAQDAFEMGKQHLDLLSIAPRLGVGFCPGDLAGHVARAFVKAPRNLSHRRLGATLRLQGARAAIARRGAIEIGRVIIHQRACRPQELAGRADVAISLVIESEVVAGATLNFRYLPANRSA